MQLITRVRQWLYPPGAWNPGYWGKLPYLLAFRCAAAAGIWWRFTGSSEAGIPDWTYIALAFAILTSIYLHWRPSPDYSRALYSIVVAVDIVVISAAYWYTSRLESDFYLLYALPIFTAAEYLRARSVLLAFAGSSIAFAVVLLTMNVEGPYSQEGRNEMMLRVLVRREAFFMTWTLIWAVRGRRERDARYHALTRQNQMQTVLECKSKVDKIFELQEALRVLVQDAGRGLNLGHAAGMFCAPLWQHPNPVEREAASIKPQPIRASIGGKPQAIESLYADCELVTKGHIIKSAVPVIAFGRRVGAIAVAGLEPHKAEAAKEYMESLAQLAAVAYERTCLFTVFGEIGAAAAIAVDHNRNLESLLDELVDKMGFEYATISLVEPYKNTVRTVRGRNVPPGWIASSVWDLNANDILADIVRHPCTLVFSGYDERFNYEMWKRYNHDRLSRMYTPIIAGGALPGVIGVIEAGCDKSRKGTILDPNVEIVRGLGEQWGDRIARGLPTVLLELIAARASELIGAESASLHVFRDGTEILVACAGKADKEFLRRFHPSPDGIGQRAMRGNTHIVLNEMPPEKADLAREGICAMAAFPLVLSDEIKGVLYIHYWREESFSQAEIELVRIFVPQMAVAIRNHLLMQDSSRVDERDWMMKGLRNVLMSLGSEPKLPELLQRLADDVQYMLDAKNVTLYQYFQQERQFSRAVLAGEFERKDDMTKEVYGENIVAKVVADGKSRFITDAQNNPFLRQERASSLVGPRFVDRERVKSCSILVLKSPYDGEIMGCLFANHAEKKDFETPELKGYTQLANLLAASSALAIKAARLHAQELKVNEEDIGRREIELEALRKIDAVIVEEADHPDIARVCDVILSEALRVLGKDVAVGGVTLWEEDKQVLRVHSAVGNPAMSAGSVSTMEEGIVGWVAKNRKACLVSDVSKDDRYRNVNAETRSELAVPIIAFDGRLLGVINVEHCNVNAFSERDKAFLEMLAVQVTIALDILRHYHNLERQCEQVSTLKTVTTRVQDAQAGTSTALRQILVGLTAKQGLRFSRAMLFETGEDGQGMRGTVSIGSMTQPKAESIWQAVGDAKLDRLLDLAARVDTAGDYTLTDTKLDETLRSISVRQEQLPPAIRACLADKTLQVRKIQASDFRNSELWPLYQEHPDCPLACIPLRAGPKILGILLVDNMFLNAQQHLSEDEPMLIAFAELILMTKLWAGMADEKQLANWREASSRAAHVLQQRVVNIENRIHDLRVDLEDRDVRAARTRVDELERTIQDINLRLEKIRRFAAPWTIVRGPLDLAYVLRHTIEARRRDFPCKIETDIPNVAVYIQGDAQHAPDMFLDLLFNASKSVSAVSNPVIKISLKADRNNNSVTVIFEDNGHGIPEEIRDKLFEPFITKSGGTGLGLPIVKYIVEQHQGEISCSPAEGGPGARFVIRLPLAASKEASTTYEPNFSG